VRTDTGGHAPTAAAIAVLERRVTGGGVTKSAREVRRAQAWGQTVGARYYGHLQGSDVGAHIRSRQLASRQSGDPLLPSPRPGRPTGSG